MAKFVTLFFISVAAIRFSGDHTTCNDEKECATIENTTCIKNKEWGTLGLCLTKCDEETQDNCYCGSSTEAKAEFCGSEMLCNEQEGRCDLDLGDKWVKHSKLNCINGKIKGGELYVKSLNDCKERCRKHSKCKMVVYKNGGQRPNYCGLRYLTTTDSCVKSAEWNLFQLSSAKRTGYRCKHKDGALPRIYQPKDGALTLKKCNSVCKEFNDCIGTSMIDHTLSCEEDCKEQHDKCTLIMKNDEITCYPVIGWSTIERDFWEFRTHSR